MFFQQLLIIRVLLVLEMREIDDFFQFVFNQVAHLNKTLTFIFPEKLILVTFLEEFLTTTINLYHFAHVVACLWIYFEDWDGLETDSRVYTDAIYFIYQTSTVVGYGDLTVDLQTPTNFFGRVVFAAVIMNFGVYFVGYTFGSINKSVARLKEISLLSSNEVALAELARRPGRLVRDPRERQPRRLHHCAREKPEDVLLVPLAIRRPEGSGVQRHAGLAAIQRGR